MVDRIPLILLVRPQMGENIGAVARAMSNFGLTELRIAAPRDGWPNPRALEMAAGGERIVREAKLYPDFESSMADIHLAYATTARPRDMEKRVVTPQEAMVEIATAFTSPPPAGGGDKRKIALVLGPERSGMENEELTLCDALISIPTAPENRSLNLAQAAVILGYEWWRAQARQMMDDGSRMLENDSSCYPSSVIRHSPQSGLATKEEWQGLFDQLESYLNAADYFRVTHKKPFMWQNLRTMLLRAQFSTQELRSFRGVLRALWERRLKK